MDEMFLHCKIVNPSMDIYPETIGTQSILFGEIEYYIRYQ